MEGVKFPLLIWYQGLCGIRMQKGFLSWFMSFQVLSGRETTKSWLHGTGLALGSSFSFLGCYFVFLFTIFYFGSLLYS